jgi:hypothetical protein
MNIQRMVPNFILENAKVSIKMSAEDSNKLCILVLPPYICKCPGGGNMFYERGTKLHKQELYIGCYTNVQIST